MRRTLEIGLLLSTDGTYQCRGRNALAGATHAIEEINGNGNADYDFVLQATHLNPQGVLQAYSEGAVQFMQGGTRHIFGTTTSASRKEISPDLEQHAGLLWCACPYEGFESSEHVLYLGGCPNQTLMPLLHYHLGATHFSELIQTLLTQKPAFILNNLVGESSYAFLQQLDTACQAVNLNLPVLSCNLTEAELGQIGDTHSLRLLSSGPFFEGVDPGFSQQQRRQHGLQIVVGTK